MKGLFSVFVFSHLDFVRGSTYTAADVQEWKPNLGQAIWKAPNSTFHSCVKSFASIEG